MSLRLSFVRLLTAACLLSCAETTRLAEPAPVVVQTLVPTTGVATLTTGSDGNQRLSRNVVPLEYDVWLALDPAQDHFTGRTRVKVRVEESTTHLDLHASKLAISKVELRDEGGRQVNVRLLAGPNAGLTVLAERAVQGEWQLDFEYEAPLDEVPESIYRVKQADGWYAYSQFEALMARQAFPCFDEPGFKTPFVVRIRVPKPLVALSNAPVRSVHPEGQTHQTFEFAPTAPIPTYLVAFAVGTFDKHQADVDAQAAGRSPGQTLPHNVYTVAGKRHLAAYAGAQATLILRALTEYFGSPYPYAKLDQVGVPTFLFGAMENVGLVTYRENILLIDDSRASHRDRATARSVMRTNLRTCGSATS